MTIQQGQVGGAPPVAAAPPSAGTQVAPLERRELTGPFRRAVFLLLLAGATFLFVFPFVWLVSASLKDRATVFNSQLFPPPLLFDNYSTVFEIAPVLNWIWNSVFVAVLAAGTVAISSALVAFAFAYFRFPFRNALFGLVLATMMLPGAVTLIPNFLIWNALGQVNSPYFTPLWAGNLFASAFYIFLLRQFFLGLPRELFEAARVDGANYLRMWWSVAVPLTRPALIVVAIFELRASWTDLYNGLIYLQNAATFTLPRGLKAVLDQFGRGGEMQWEIVLAASVIITLPMIVIFFLGQRYFVEGIATTGSKG